MSVNGSTVRKLHIVNVTFVLQDIEAFIKADPYVKADLVSGW